jgi:hypothetical protein
LRPAIDWIAASDLEDESAQSVMISFKLYLKKFGCFSLCKLSGFFHFIVVLLFQTPEAHAAAWKTLKVSALEAHTVYGGLVYSI